LVFVRVRSCSSCWFVGLVRPDRRPDQPALAVTVHTQAGAPSAMVSWRETFTSVPSARENAAAS
jgi:hypothetical protein